MKIRYPLLPVLVLAALFAVVAPRASHAVTAASFDFFYDSLDPYGEWVEVPDYGYCWHPSGVDGDWAPYSDGYWAYTDAGWTWVSYEDWGAITYHYGRWVRLNDLGWCWVPGYEWGPAWVSWRSSDEYVGWAPLPPEVVFVNNVGISIWVDSAYGIGPGYYNFCRYHDFGAPAMRPCIINRNQNIVIINNTTNITNITVNPHRRLVFNGGPDYRLMQKRSARPIQTLRLVQQTDINAAKASGNGFMARQHGNQLDVLAPVINQPAAGEKPRPKNIGKVMTTSSVDKGWSRVPDAQAKQLQNRFQQQSGGLTPETSHAKPVAEKDLRIIADNAKAPTAANLPAVTSPNPAVGNDSTQFGGGKRKNGQPSPSPLPAVTTTGAEPGVNDAVKPTPTPRIKGGKLQPSRSPIPAALEPAGVPSTQTINPTPTPSGNNKHRRDPSQTVPLQPFTSQGTDQSNPVNNNAGQAAQANQLNREKAIENKRQQDADLQQKRALQLEQQQQARQQRLDQQQQVRQQRLESQQQKQAGAEIQPQLKSTSVPQVKQQQSPAPQPRNNGKTKSKNDPNQPQ
jgi:hypothetical protein